MNRSEILRTARLAGQTLRYHTWPVHRQQSNGEHMWQQARIYFMIWGPLDPVVSTNIMWSDCGELKTGDLPFPMKSSNPDIKATFDRMESDAVVNMGGPYPVTLGTIERTKIKICDLVEMLEFGLTEELMGNQFAGPIVTDTRELIVQKLASLPAEVARPAYVYLTEHKLFPEGALGRV